MKRIMTLFLSLVLIFPMVIQRTAAEEYTDPWGNVIPSDVVELADPEEDDRLYEFYFARLEDIGVYENIDEMLASASFCNKNERYFVLDKGKDSQLFVAYRDGKSAEPYEMQYGWLSSQYYYDMIYSVSPDIVIEQAYHFYGHSLYSGNAVYFKTNLGDYAVTNMDEGVLTGEAFFKSQKDRILNRLGFTPISEKGQQYLLWIILANVLLFASIITVVVIRRKKKKGEKAVIPQYD